MKELWPPLAAAVILTTFSWALARLERVEQQRCVAMMHSATTFRDSLLIVDVRSACIKQFDKMPREVESQR